MVLAPVQVFPPPYPCLCSSLPPRERSLFRVFVEDLPILIIIIILRFSSCFFFEKVFIGFFETMKVMPANKTFKQSLPLLRAGHGACD